MKPSKLLSVLASGVLVGAPMFASLGAMPSSSEASPSCQCTQYVANRFGLRGFPHAGDWNDGFLQRNGFRQVAPRVGTIVIMERSFPGSNTSFGHVGIVESIDGRGRITVRGANQYVGTRLVNEAGCSNARSTQFGTSINGRRDISFWAR
ncbi:CHAP domain-containing protein [Tumidithrix elongata RA019]|uniref:CHAP domain-containing protein n=1 Tax=Tumidithrix elongata BACA0141 TaxID=2716417 RepID=A0AAW9Q0P3_9CYAN|nr:CHAP domain-containing protein [Tumidithrix elongata RA019]